MKKDLLNILLLHLIVVQLTDANYFGKRYSLDEDEGSTALPVQLPPLDTADARRSDDSNKEIYRSKLLHMLLKQIDEDLYKESRIRGEENLKPEVYGKDLRHIWNPYLL
ncbi:uncharacterized protein [Watersipora subatra]|uniref:uncharacterized protein n=1 Tax=Watersipora subatra TaxID=2589382 RepID=UPI00355BD01C